MKKKLAWIMVVAMVMSFAFTVPAYAAEGDFTVHVQAPAEWTEPALWAWSVVDGVSTNVFTAWPGQLLTADPDNAGWFYYPVPATTNFIIANNNGGGAQTADTEIQPQEVWFTVASDLTAAVVYEAPEGFVSAAAEEAAATDTAADVPKTGVVGLGLVYGLGVLATGAVALKKRNK